FEPGWQRFMVAWCPCEILPCFLELLLTSMDLIHESTTPEAGLRPWSLGFVLDCVVMVCPIPIGFTTWRPSCARRRGRRFVGSYNQSGRPVWFVRQHGE